MKTLPLLDLKTEEKCHEPRKAGSLQKLKGKETDFPLELPERNAVLPTSQFWLREPSVGF